ncbi:MAG: amidohydrolase family protein [Lacunisphaera sp.]
MIFRRCLALLSVVAACVASLSGADSPPPAPAVLVIKAGHLVDPASGTVLKGQAIVIEGDRVKSVGPIAGLVTPAGARVIDLGDATVLPGLIDCHTHVTSQPENFYEDIFRKSPIDEATTSHIYAKRTLDAGFTTIRNVGADNYVDFALRNAINAGKLPGPRMLASGPRAQRHRRPWRSQRHVALHSLRG